MTVSVGGKTAILLLKTRLYCFAALLPQRLDTVNAPDMANTLSKKHNGKGHLRDAGLL